MSPRKPVGRDHLVTAAMHTIAERGFAGATTRAVAELAGVTPGLVVHHFGTKEALAAEVERVVLARFDAALDAAFDPSVAAGDAATAISQRLADTIGPDEALRRYVRRAILDATPAGATILARLVSLTRGVLDRFGADLGVSAGVVDRDWLAVQIVTINLSATLLEPLLGDVLGRDPFSPDEVARRTSANLAFLTAALGRRR